MKFAYFSLGLGLASARVQRKEYQDAQGAAVEIFENGEHTGNCPDLPQFLNDLFWSHHDNYAIRYRANQKHVAIVQCRRPKYSSPDPEEAERRHADKIARNSWLAQTDKESKMGKYVCATDDDGVGSWRTKIELTVECPDSSTSGGWSHFHPEPCEEGFSWDLDQRKCLEDPEPTTTVAENTTSTGFESTTAAPTTAYNPLLPFIQLAQHECDKQTSCGCVTGYSHDHNVAKNAQVGTKIWHDREYVFQVLPEELQGADLIQQGHRLQDVEGKTQVHHDIAVPATVYVFATYEENEDGDLPYTLTTGDGWSRVYDAGEFWWGNPGEANYKQFVFWKKHVDSLGEATIKVGDEKWIGGVMLKMDCGETPAVVDPDNNPLLPFILQAQVGCDKKTSCGCVDYELKETGKSHDFEVQRDVQFGTKVWYDRDYIFTSVPEELRGGEVLQQAHRVNGIEGKNKIYHDIGVPATVYVFFTDDDTGSMYGSVEWSRVEFEGGDGLAWGSADRLDLTTPFNVYKRSLSNLGDVTFFVGDDQWMGGVILKLECGDVPAAPEPEAEPEPTPNPLIPFILEAQHNCVKQTECGCVTGYSHDFNVAQNAQIGTQIWHDRDYIFTDLPEMLQGAVLIQQGHKLKDVEGKTKVYHDIAVPADVYVFAEYNGNDADLPYTLTTGDGWARVYEAGGFWWGGSDGANHKQFIFWHKHVDNFGEATIKVGDGKWNGGVMLKLDCGEI